LCGRVFIILGEGGRRRWGAWRGWSGGGSGRGRGARSSTRCWGPAGTSSTRSSCSAGPRPRTSLQGAAVVGRTGPAAEGEAEIGARRRLPPESVLAKDRGEILEVVRLVDRPGPIERGQDPQQFLLQEQPCETGRCPEPAEVGGERAHQLVTAHVEEEVPRG